MVVGRDLVKRGARALHVMTQCCFCEADECMHDA